MPCNKQGRYTLTKIIPCSLELSNVLLDIHEMKTCLKLPDPRTLHISTKHFFLQGINVFSFLGMQQPEKLGNVLENFVTDGSITTHSIWVANTTHLIIYKVFPHRPISPAHLNPAGDASIKPGSVPPCFLMPVSKLLLPLRVWLSRLKMSCHCIYPYTWLWKQGSGISVSVLIFMLYVLMLIWK